MRYLRARKHPPCSRNTLRSLALSRSVSRYASQFCLVASLLHTPFKVAANVMGCTPYYMPKRVDDLRYCTGDEATEFVKVKKLYIIFKIIGHS